MSTVRYAVIVPVWGATHVERFLRWALPSWLSPGNLPALSANVDVIVLAGRQDIARIKDDPIAALLARHCAIRFAEIDDLIPGGISTVTLTLAFTRGANLALAGGARPRLIFLNADFLLTDGSIAAIARRLDAGQRLLLSASVRVREEIAAPLLGGMRRDDGPLVAPARETVRIALGALHPTVLACRVDQPMLASAHPNQFFWQVGQAALLLRAFLLFPLAVVPERVPGPAEMYCDYGWIAEFAPGARADIIPHSDEVFIVEMAPTGQELDFVRAGPVDPAECARRISCWITDFSRAQPLTPIVFAAADAAPGELERDTSASERFVAELLRDLGPSHPPKAHPYWLAGAAAWLRNRRQAAVQAIPPELRPPPELPARNLALSAVLRAAVRRVLLGEPGRRRRWHPFWNAERLVRQLGPVRIVTAGALLAQFDARSTPAGVPLGVLEISDGASASEVADQLAAAVGPGGRAYLVVGHSAWDAAHLVSVRERVSVLAAVEQGFVIHSCSTLVSSDEAVAASRHRRLAVEFHLVTPLRAFVFLAASAFSLFAVWGGNARRASDRARADADAATLLLTLERRPMAVKVDASALVAKTAQRSGFQP